MQKTISEKEEKLIFAMALIMIPFVIDATIRLMQLAEMIR